MILSAKNETAKNKKTIQRMRNNKAIGLFIKTIQVINKPIAITALIIE